jgi:hypothetical protein
MKVSDALVVMNLEEAPSGEEEPGQEPTPPG